MAVVILLQTITSVTQAAQPTYQIYTSKELAITSQEMAKLVDYYNVIVFGEYHDNDVLHKLETEFLVCAFTKQPKLAVSLEMFERDTQEMLDDYLADKISETEFLDKSRPWKNYQADYRPLVEFAKNNSLPVLAANIPRPLAAQYAKEGSLEAVAEEMKVYLPKIHLHPEGQYQQNFIKVMSNNSGKMPVTADKINNYYKAQCLKDDTMAESIAEFCQLNPDYKVIHYQGDFHSRYHLGAVEKLQQLAPHLKVAVITPVYVENFAEIPDLIKQYKNDGNIIIFLKQVK
ncbi:ChaN family lipoprotein [Selenomonadales bacterium OttesenSCG-928-I06]|nr:ChaN family lipoprotein [Selenomonadales bacterium OttesenSCG-928-I06]